MQKIKIITILIFAVVLLEIVAAIVSIVGFHEIENRFLLIDKFLWEEHSEIIQQSMSDDYPLSSYLKDSVINAQLYRSIIVILMGFILITTLGTFYIYVKKSGKCTG